MELNCIPILRSLLRFPMPAFPALMTHSGSGCALARIVEDIFALKVAVLLMAALTLVIFDSILFVGDQLERSLGLVLCALGLLVNSALIAHFVIVLFDLRGSCI